MEDSKQDALTVSFGKYKGQSVAVMLADKQYVTWLCQQSWFAKSQPIIYNIVNQVAPDRDAPTPEHNALQNLFLDADYCKRLLVRTRVFRDLNLRERLDVGVHAVAPSKASATWECTSSFEIWPGLDVLVCGKATLVGDVRVDRDAIRRKYMEEAKEDGRSALDKDEEEEFAHEIDTWTKTPKSTLWSYDARCLVEIKPVLGDDYPCVLRKFNQWRALVQARRSKELCGCEWWLFVGHFESTVTTRKQLGELFARSGVNVILRKELEADADD